MKVDEITQAFSGGHVAQISRDDIERLLEAGELIRETATGLAGTIRTLRIGGEIFVQERNPEGDVFLRRFATEETATRFIEARTASYERMWDG
ncbi:MAG: hypothetical protein V2I67_03520 [Thermoanaerobaculales bacterium]|jgi:hypothetical protein|nr:hypothetical protein [Thermoanaerobaculales bacterium]